MIKMPRMTCDTCKGKGYRWTEGFHFVGVASSCQKCSKCAGTGTVSALVYNWVTHPLYLEARSLVWKAEREAREAGA